MLAFRPADTEDAPRQPLKTVGISQATVDSAHSVAAARVAAPVVPAAVAPVVSAPVAPAVASVAAAPAPAPAPVPEAVAPIAVPEPVIEAVAVDTVVDLPWNDPVEPEVVQQPAIEPVLDTAAEHRITADAIADARQRRAGCPGMGRCADPGTLRERSRRGDTGHGPGRRAAAGRGLHRAGHGFVLQLPGRTGQRACRRAGSRARTRTGRHAGDRSGPCNGWSCSRNCRSPA